MTARQAVDAALVTDLARAMLDRAAAVEPAQIAAERRAFEPLCTAYFADPRQALAGGDAGGGQLKIGLPGVEELLTPVFLAAAAEVVTYLAERGAQATRRAVHRLLHPPADRTVGGVEAGAGPALSAAPEVSGTRPSSAAAPAPDAADGLTREQWTEVRAILAQALVRHARMTPQRADLIAAAVVGEGLTGQPRQ